MKYSKILFFFIIISMCFPYIPISKAQSTFTEDFTTSNYILTLTDVLHNTTNNYIWLDVTTSNDTYAEAFNNDSLVVSYNFDSNDTASNVIDSMNNSNGTLTGSGDEYSTSYFFNRSLHFDGNGEYISVGDVANIDGTASNTVTWWVYCHNYTYPAPEQWWWRKPSVYGFRERIMLDYWEIGGVTATVSIDPSYTLVDYDTQYMVAQYDSLTNSMRFWVNGTLLDDYSNKNAGTLKNLGHNLVIGAYDSGFYYSNITIDNFRYYSRYLNESELFEEFKPRTENTGYITSKNLLGGLSSDQIDEIEINCSISSGGNMEIQFSENGLDWYDSNGDYNQTDVLSDGVNTIDLETLEFTSNIQYRCFFDKSSTTLPTSPYLYKLTVTYQTSMEIAILNYNFIVLIVLILLGLLALWKPFIFLITISISIMVIYPQISGFDSFMRNLSVACVTSQVFCGLTGMAIRWKFA